MWVLDGRDDALYGYDLESGELLAGYALDDDNDDPRGIWSDGDVMYVADASDGRVYTYNMPDGIDARLASLALSDVEIGEFSRGQPEYESVAADGATQTTVEARPEQSRARVAIDPPDADEVADGHQVALDGLDEISVTVTSPDESRRKVYLVRIGDAAEAERSPAPCLSGAVAVGFSILIYEGGGIGDLVGCAESRHVTVLYALEGGAYVPYILGAPGFVNRPFLELYAEGVPAVTLFIAGSDGPATADPASDGGAAQSWPECLRGDVAAGFSLVLYEGGSVEEVGACAQGRGVTALYALEGGAYVSYILGAPEFVNRPFFELFADGLAPMAPLIARSEGPPAAIADRGDVSDS